MATENKKKPKAKKPLYKTCIIMDWNGKKKKVKVPYLTRVVTIEMAYGDMTMTKPVYADSCTDRHGYSCDSEYKIKLKDCPTNDKGEFLLYEAIDE